MIINDDISKVFIGKAKKAGIDSLDDLLLYLPKEYKDYGDIAMSISPHISTDIAKVFKLKVLSQPKLNSRKGYISFFLGDGFSTVSAVFFGVFEALKKISRGDIIHVEGKIDKKGEFTSFRQPTLVESHMLNKLMPIYRGVPGVISPSLISKNIKILLKDNLPEFALYLSEKFSITDEDLHRLNLSFKTISEMFIAIHMPDDKITSEEALRSIRLMNAKSALSAALKSVPVTSCKESVITYGIEDIKRLMAMLPFNLTKSQKRSVWEITQDLNSDKPMDRLLSGDVGFGKTLAYGIPAVCTHLAGKICIIMTPNTLLSMQIATELKETFNIENVRLVLGDNEPRPTEEELKESPIIVGTSAIIHWIEGADFDLVPDFLIVDEQQKLGNQQKLSIMKEKTNFLEATATSIPRTTALVVYGNKKVSYLTECPVEKQITTAIIGKENQKKAFTTLKKIVSIGKQIAVLYPIRQKDYMFYDYKLSSDDSARLLSIVTEVSAEAITNVNGKNLIKLQKAQKTKLDKILKEEKFYCDFIEMPDLESAEDNKRNVESAYKLWDDIYPGKVVMIHGGLNAKDKLEALRIAQNGECSVIITSSVIEIGLTMPDLMGIFIKNADRYGASTLHQFRGRISRKGGRGLFMMGVDCQENEMSDKSSERLNLLVKHTKGYDIAEEDMKQRGFGDLEKDGTMQSGGVDGLFKGVKVMPEDVENLIKCYNLQ